MSNLLDEEINIKILILYLLEKIEYPAEKEDLSGICCLELNEDYFSFSDCLVQLVDSGHVTEEDNLYSLTVKGKTNLAALFDSIPFSVRKKAEKLAAPIKAKQSRLANITAEYFENNGAINVHFALSDGKGDLMNLQMVCSSEDAAKKMKKKFRKDAENYYLKIIEMFH